jgi:hypothetical protein
MSEEYFRKESQSIRDKNLLDGNKRIIVELSAKIVALKKRAQEAEGETTIVKGIGMNSPEMKELQAINENHQKLNGKLQTRLTEVEEDNKKLAKQIQDLNSRLSS